MQVIENRPNPLRDQLRKIAPAIASLVGLVNFLGSLGILSSTQVTAAATYGDQVIAASADGGPLEIVGSVLIGLVTGAVALFGILKAGKGATDETTPVKSPRDIDGTALVRSDGLPLGGIRANGRHADAGEQAPAGY